MLRYLKQIVGGIALLIGLIITLIPFHIAPVCQRLLELTTGRMIPMRCNYTGQAEVLLGLTIMLISLIYFFVKSTEARKSIGLVMAILGLLVIVMPTNLGIGVCMNPMECHTTARILYILGGLLIVNGFASFLEKSQNC